MRLLLIISLVFISNAFNAQNVGVGTTAPTNSLHIVPSSGVDPLKIESINNFGAERNLLIIEPTQGIVKHIHVDSLINLIKDSIDTDNQDLDSLKLTGTTLTAFIENGTSASVDLSGLVVTNSDDQNIDSIRLTGTMLTVYIEDGAAANVDLSTIQDGTGTDNQNIDSVRLFGTDLTIFIEDGLSSTVSLSSLQDGTGTDDQDIDSLSLTGNTLTIHIEDGNAASIDLSPVLDTVTPHEWINGSETGLVSEDIYARRALANADTVVVTSNGRIGVNTSTPEAEIEVVGSHQNVLIDPSVGIIVKNDTLWNGGWSRGLFSNVEGNYKGAFGHYGTGRSAVHSFITGDNQRADYRDPDLTVLALNGNVGVGSRYPQTKFEIEVENDTTQENIGGFSLTSKAALGSYYSGLFRLKMYSSSRLNGTATAVFDSTVATISSNCSHSWKPRALALGTSNSERMRITPIGEIGIGTTLPTELLDVNGNARFRAVASGAYANDLSITADGTLTTNSSDRRLKTNIAKLNYGLDEVLKLNPVSYNWIETKENEKKDMGFVAQEIKKIIPESVFKNVNDGYYGVNYTRIIPVLTNAIQEQQAIINNQKSIIEEQNARLLKIEQRLNNIEKQ